MEQIHSGPMTGRTVLVTANALHPGVVRTSFGAEDPARDRRTVTIAAGNREAVRPGCQLPSRPSLRRTTWRARSKTAGSSCSTKLVSVARMIPFSSNASR